MLSFVFSRLLLFSGACSQVSVWSGRRSVEFPKMKHLMNGNNVSRLLQLLEAPFACLLQIHPTFLCQAKLAQGRWNHPSVYLGVPQPNSFLVHGPGTEQCLQGGLVPSLFMPSLSLLVGSFLGKTSRGV